MHDFRPYTFNVDLTTPTVTISSPTASTYNLGQSVPATYSCSDPNGSGIASSGCSATLNGSSFTNASLPTSSAGPYNFTVTATNKAGTSHTQTVDYNVSQATPSVSSIVDDAATPGTAWSGNEVTGASAYDTSTVAGAAGGSTPMGTLTYSFFTNGSCSGTAATTGSVTLSGGLVPSSANTSPLAAGNYSFEASYSGDPNYTGPTASSCEPFTVGTATPSVGSTVGDAATAGTAWSGDEVTGAAAYDTSTVTGVAGFTPTGTLTYSFFTNGTCAGTASTTNKVTLSGGTVPNSADTSALAAGNYSFEASYSGDSNYAVPASTCEPFVVSTATPAVGTTVYDGTNTAWNGSEATGAAAYDTSTVTGVAGFTPTGTLTYSFFTNGTCAATASTTDKVTLSSGTVANSNKISNLAAGNYSFEATYSGDPNYAGPKSTCEPFTVAATASSVGTVVYDARTGKAWNWAEMTGASAYDTATVSAIAGFTATGTVSYSLFANGTCSGTASTTGTVTLSGGKVPNSTATSALAAGPDSFQAAYSGNANYKKSTGSCEPFSVAKAPAFPGALVFDASTGHAWNWAEVTGASAYDVSAIFGAPGFTPTGTVTYNFYTNGACSGTASTTGKVTLSGGKVPSSTATSALAAGPTASRLRTRATRTTWQRRATASCSWWLRLPPTLPRSSMMPRPARRGAVAR